MAIQPAERNWIAQLSSSEPQKSQAIADLRNVLVKGLRHGLAGYARSLGREFDALVEDFVQEALLRVLDNLDSFEGRSRFTTWAYKITIRVALTEIRRKRWKDVSLDSLMSPEGTGALFLSSPNTDPEVAFLRSDIMRTIRTMIWEELTEKQRKAMNAVLVKEMPMEEVARRMDMNRNALYKLLHDGRKKLKSRLMKEGMNPAEMIGMLHGR